MNMMNVIIRQIIAGHASTTARWKTVAAHPPDAVKKADSIQDRANQMRAAPLPVGLTTIIDHHYNSNSHSMIARLTGNLAIRTVQNHAEDVRHRLRGIAQMVPCVQMAMMKKFVATR